jgi:hypothetical protein
MPLILTRDHNLIPTRYYLTPDSCLLIPARQITLATAPSGAPRKPDNHTRITLNK